MKVKRDTLWYQVSGGYVVKHVSTRSKCLPGISICTAVLPDDELDDTRVAGTSKQ